MQNCWLNLFHEVLLFVYPSWRVRNTTTFNSKAPNISHTQRCRALSLRYIHVNAEGKNPDEDNDDEEEKINFVIEDVNQVENKQPGETKLIKSKMRSKASVIDDDGT